MRDTHLRPAGERPESTARGLHHTALISSDVERTVRFYQELLGFPLTELIENRDYAGSSHFLFDIGNGNLLAFVDFPGLEVTPYAEVLGGLHHSAISNVDATGFENIVRASKPSGVTVKRPRPFAMPPVDLGRHGIHDLTERASQETGLDLFADQRVELVSQRAPGPPLLGRRTAPEPDRCLSCRGRESAPGSRGRFQAALSGAPLQRPREPIDLI